MAGNYLQFKVLTHGQKVCRLYKRVLRNIESHRYEKHDYRRDCTLMRARFEKFRGEKDLRVAAQLLSDGQEELKLAMHPQPKEFGEIPGGLLTDRYLPTPDYVLDYWHPLEKAQYPEYFARREQRKIEYIQNWEKKYGKPNPDDDHH